jgi:hypothetical protein
MPYYVFVIRIENNCRFTFESGYPCGFPLKLIQGIMKHLITLFLSTILLVQLPGYSQVNTFSRKLVFANDTSGESVYATVVLNNRFYVIGDGNTNGPTPNITIAEIDSSGSKLWSKSYGDSTKIYMTGFYQAAITTSDGNIMLTGVKIDHDIPYTFNTVLFKFSPDGDTLWTKILHPEAPANSYGRGFGLIQTSDLGFAIFGDGPYGGIIYKTDSEGNIQWKRSILDDTAVDYSSISSLEELPGKQYLLGGTWIYPHVSQGRQNGMIILLDSLGNTIWSDTVHSDLDFFVAWDGLSGFTGIGNRPVAWYNQGNRIHLTHFNQNGQLDKERWIGDSVTYHQFYNLLVLPDSTYLISGTVRDDSSFIFNFNHNLDSLFYRTYLYPATNPAKVPMSIITDGTICPDGGILFGGELDTLIGSTLLPVSWLLKTDRYGCMQPGCDPNGIYILKQPASDTLHSFERAFFSILATGDSLHYSWQFRTGSGWNATLDTSIYKESDDTLLVNCKNLAPGDYRFRCMVYNHYYRVFSKEALLHIILGIGETLTENVISVFPNPVTNTFEIRSTELIKGIRLINPLGQDCFPTKQIENNQAIVDMGSFVTGIYFIRIETEKRTYFKKIIKE